MNQQKTTSSGLHEFFIEHLDMLSTIIKHGYKNDSLTIPALDPLSLGTDISGKVDIKRAQVAIKFVKPILSGLASINANSDMDLDLSARTVRMTLSFAELKFSSDDFNLDGQYKLLLKHNISSEGYFEMLAQDIKLNITLAFDLSQSTVNVSPKSAVCEIDNFEFDIDDSYVLSKLLPFFKSRFEQLIADTVARKITDFIQGRLQQVCLEQGAVLAKLKGLYKLKKQQVGDNTEKPRLLSGLDGVGELPLPMFWQIPSIDPLTAPKIELMKLVEEAKTGDLILFAGSYPSSLRIRRLTQSRYSHVVVVIKEPEIEGGRACVWQATSSTHEGVLRNMEPKSGVQLNYLDEMLRDYRAEDANSLICHRSGIHSELTKKLVCENWPEVKKFINFMDGKPYTNDMDGLYIMGLMEVDNPNKEDYFCAGLVADTLMKLGLLCDEFRQYQYAPRDFSELQKSLPLIHPPMHFGAETLILGI